MGNEVGLAGPRLTNGQILVWPGSRVIVGAVASVIQSYDV
jgi:hypothetical protein